MIVSRNDDKGHVTVVGLSHDLLESFDSQRIYQSTLSQ